MPDHARPFFQYVADVTVQKMTMTVRARGPVSRVSSTKREIRRTFDGAIDGAEERRLTRCEAEAGDDDLTWVAQLRGKVRNLRWAERMRVPTEFVTFLQRRV